VLAPAPAVDDEPMATMVMGLPLVSFCATRASGLVKRTSSSGASQPGAAARAVNGHAKAMKRTAAAMGFAAHMAKSWFCKLIPVLA
jgi:hypothetical protein